MPPTQIPYLMIVKASILAVPTTIPTMVSSTLKTEPFIFKGSDCKPNSQLQVFLPDSPQERINHLFRLPLELRLMIWNLCLLSPTGLVEPIDRKLAYYRQMPKSNSPSGPQFYLIYQEDNSDSYLTLSLLRTCRQICEEAFPLFWKKNTFLFNSPSGFLKFSTQKVRFASQYITSLHLNIASFQGTALNYLEKVADSLTKRRPSESAFCQLTLALQETEIVRLLVDHISGDLRTEEARISDRFVDLERIFRKVAQGLFDKVLHVECTPTGGVDGTDAFVEEILEKVISILAGALGGKCFWGSDLVYDGFMEANDAF
ncbi:hypothetical protein G7Y89_g13213 [Cudoniella acicularis]|uniref:DUF7730 domain-containing protein n=1 Tax=Cudoniella acicularis TaxID=354080 RepID=A0A8H4R8P2_9HELO|nr:hypothetical protein G7Y89_g13213 [Cudoniella acicularis]